MTLVGRETGASLRCAAVVAVLQVDDDVVVVAVAMTRSGNVGYY